MTLNGERPFEAHWFNAAFGDAAKPAIVVPVDRLNVRLSNDQSTTVELARAGNQLSGAGRSSILAKSPRPMTSDSEDVYVELLSGSVSWDQPDKSSLFSSWKLLSIAADGKETILFENCSAPKPAGQ